MDDAGLHSVSLIVTGIGIVVLLLTALDRQLAKSDRAPVPLREEQARPGQLDSKAEFVAA